LLFHGSSGYTISRQYRTLRTLHVTLNICYLKLLLQTLISEVQQTVEQVVGGGSGESDGAFCALTAYDIPPSLRLVRHRKAIRIQDLLNWKQNSGRVKMCVNPWLTTSMKVNIRAV
jgi:regulation of enolase protein 1 (concanavalin A-like superfamily)